MSVQPPGAKEIVADLQRLMTPRREGACENELLASCQWLIALASKHRKVPVGDSAVLDSVRAMLREFVAQHGSDKRDASLAKKELSSANQIMVVARAIRLWESMPKQIVPRRKAATKGMAIGVGIFKTGRRATGIDRYCRTFADALLAYLQDDKPHANAGAAVCNSERLSESPEAQLPSAAPASGTWGRLRAMSERLTRDIDLNGTDGVGALTLSEGAYVPRVVEAVILNRLYTDSSSTEIVVGAAGHGKTTLLWSLHRHLRDAFNPLLLSAAWLRPDDSGNRILSPGDILDAVGGQDRVVVLLDTADLLLHSEWMREEILTLRDALSDQRIPMVVTTRPREALTLPNDLGHHVTLDAYVDDEINQAVPPLVRSYCPNDPSAPSDPVDAIKQARARGLIVEEVYSSPLLLRMLFELASPDFPGLEVGVTGLYRNYWQGRVEADLRGRTASDRRSVGGDLSEVAGLVGIALVALGRPVDAAETVVRRASEAAADAGSGIGQEQLRDGTELLVQRGVLVKTGATIQFMHQTLFEFAAAKGLASRSSERELPRLVERLLKTPDNLFLCAVVEQLLILLGDDNIAFRAVADAVSRLAASGHPSLIETAMIVWAHHPRLPEIQAETIARADPQAIDRFVRVVAGSMSPAAAIETLDWIWINHSSLRRNVINACARMASRSPHDIAAFISRHYALYVLHGELFTPGITDILIETVLVHSPTYGRDAFLRLFQLPDLLLFGQFNIEGAWLEYLHIAARLWPTVGSEQFLDEIERVADELTGRVGRGFNQALAEVVAAQWEQSINALPPDAQKARWRQTIDEVCRELDDESLPWQPTLEPGTTTHIWDVWDSSPRSGARLIAVALRIRLLAILVT